jgi:hypothetical protein|tara:strand:+ start:37 stop:315 length:279 start_codon:yes stop_codon:yes gene_type:complete
MTLTKATVVDKAETVKIFDHYCIQVRERKQILEDGEEISSSFHRYVLQPDADTSTISDPVVLAQFNAVMTSEVKANYQAFLASQNEPETTEE